MICRRFEPSEIDAGFLPDYVAEITRSSLQSPISFKLWKEHRKEQRGWVYEPLPGYRTCDAAFAEELREAGTMLLEHIRKENPARPLNALIVGPPGSGKTFLAERLFNFLKECNASGEYEVTGQKQLLFMEFNVADFITPGGLIEMFDEIRRKGKENKIVVFIDEFDVTIGGTSVIRHLINPIYTGKYATTAADEESLGHVAFVFSGGYIRSKHILKILQHETSKFDLPRLLADLSASRLGIDNAAAEEVKLLLDAIVRCRQVNETIESDTDIFRYLSRLDKLEDFLSRINGFIVEIPDVSDPLYTTTDPLAASDDFIPDEFRDQGSDFSDARDIEADSLQQYEVRAAVLRPRSQAVAERMRDFILAYERISLGGRIQTFDRPWTAARVYKCMLMCERLIRLLHLFAKTFKGQIFVIERHILHFLITVPLAHGSRSLEFLVSLLSASDETPPRLTLSIEKLASAGFLRHARSVYGAPPQFWRRFCRTNKINIVDFPGDGLVEINTLVR